MHSIDMILLNKFQDISDWFQEWFGITNFTIARVCLVLGMCSLGLARVISLSITKDVSFLIIIAIFFDLIWMIMVSNLIRNIKNIEEECLNNPQFTNFLAIQWFLLRIVFLMLLLLRFTPSMIEISHSEKSLMMVRGFLLRSESILVVLGFYFASCTPKPYKPSKVKKWLKSFVESIQATVAGVFSPAPELATVRVAKNRRVAQRPILATGSAFYFIHRYDILLL